VNRVTCVDIDKAKVKKLSVGQIEECYLLIRINHLSVDYWQYFEFQIAKKSLEFDQNQDRVRSYQNN
jgi:hypothetical protein